MSSEVKKLLDEVEDFCRKKDLFDGYKVIVAAVSGGGDSVFMLWALRRLARKFGFMLRAVHINHMIRGDDSNQDELFVRKLCRTWRIPLDVFTIDVPKKAETLRLGIEEAARLVRREIFEEQAYKYGALVALAHTADDQVETFVFNLLRGSGIRGLAGMKVRTGVVIRPIMVLWREDIRRALIKLEIPWREDYSNWDMRYTRNRIRHRLIPFIIENFGKDSVKHIFRATEMLDFTRRALERAFARYINEAFLGEACGVIAFKASLALSDEFTFGEVLRQSLPRLGVGLKGFSIERVSHVFWRIISSKREYPIYGGAFAMREGNCLFIAKTKVYQLKTAEVPIGGFADLGCIGRVSATTIPLPDEPKSDNPLVATIAYDGSPIYVAPHTPGLLFHPLGGSTMKVSSFVKSRGVPLIFRRAVPLVFIGERLAWVAGVEIAEPFKLTSRTKNVVKLEWSGLFPELFLKALTEAKKEFNPYKSIG